MKITSITPQKNINRVNIYIDDEFAFGLENELRYKYDLYTGKEISKEFLEDILEAAESKKVINDALHFLSYRQRTEKEIYTKLKTKGYEEQHIAKAIQYCKERKYIDDENFAINFIKDKININKFGPNRIKRELISKGVSVEIIDKLLNMDSDEEYEIAMELALKKISSYRNDTKEAKYRKLGGFLQRRGYSYDVVSRILKKII